MAGSIGNIGGMPGGMGGGLSGLPGAGGMGGGISGLPGGDDGGGFGSGLGVPGGPTGQPTTAQADSFSSTLGELVLERPSASKAEAGEMAARLAAGENIDPHQVAIMSAKAGVEVQMATRTISQAVTAVRTLFQMQV